MLSVERKLVVVPWFSRCEFKHVQQLLFSDKLDDQKKGLDFLMGWKVRCPTLHAPIESTLLIFQVLHDDSEYILGKSVSISRDQQLRLMYSTAVMRFLNLVLDKSAYDRESDESYVTMYSRAERLNIPQWIVSLRNDAAHGTSLPDLGLLRTAAALILKWLQENYWENESKLFKNWHVTRSDITELYADEGELVTIVETLETLNLYQLAGFKSMQHVPDSKLRKTIETMHEILQYEPEEAPWARELNLAKVSSAVTLVLRKLVLCLGNRSTAVDKRALLADLLVDGEVLLPSENTLKILYPSGIGTENILQTLPKALVDVCEDFMCALWISGAIPALTSKLIIVSSNANRSSLEKNMAALWIQKIVLSCLKVRETTKVHNPILGDTDAKVAVEHYRGKISRLMKNKKMISSSLASVVVESYRSDLKVGYAWQLQQIPVALTNVNLVKQSISSPSKFTNIFLPSLLELIAPAIPLNTRKVLTNVINVYCNDNLEVDPSPEDRIFSLDDVCDTSTSHSASNDHSQNQDNFETSQSGTIQPCLQSQSPWVRSQEHLEWDKCPLGVLPWQKEKSVLNEEENQMRKMRLLWPKLFLPLGWTNAEQQSEEHPCEQTISESTLHESPAFRHVKIGRVSKAYKSAAVHKFSRGYSERAVKFLMGL